MENIIWGGVLIFLSAVVVGVVAGIVVAEVFDFRNYRWYRKRQGGHWERWSPGLTPWTHYWMLGRSVNPQQPERVCSQRDYGFSTLMSGKRLTRCEDWPSGETTTYLKMEEEAPRA